MRTRVARRNGFQTVRGQPFRKRTVIENRLQMRLHLRSVKGDQKVRPWTEKMLGIVPRRGDQGNATSQRLKWPNCGNSGKRLSIRPAGHMYCDAIAGEHFRNLIV